MAALPHQSAPFALAGTADRAGLAFQLTDSGNSEIAHVWLLLAIRSEYSPADERLERYLTRIGRRKLIQPLYEALAETPTGRARALEIYRRARPGYHPISAETIDRILG